MLPSLPILCLFAVIPGFQDGTSAPSPPPDAVQVGQQAPIGPVAPIHGQVASPVPLPAAPVSVQTAQPPVLEDAIRVMESHLTITATFRQQVDMFDRHLVGSGNYWEVRQPACR